MKAGRKRKVVRRQPNGQPYRPPVDAREVVTEARARQFGFTKKRAQEQWAGYEIGRMAIRGMFGPPDEAQKAISAVEAYIKATVDFMRLKCPSHPIPKAMNYLAGRGASLAEEPSDASVKRVVDRYKSHCDKLAKADGIARMAFHEVAFHDRPCTLDRVEAVKACVILLKAA